VETKESWVADRNRSALPLCNRIDNAQNEPYENSMDSSGKAAAKAAAFFCLKEE